MPPSSPRLAYRRLETDDAEVFHQLVTNVHIRRFLMDGQVMSATWSTDEIRKSDELFDSQGVGLWLVFASDPNRPIGFAGFRVFEEMGPEAQLLYALVEAATGQCYATEIAHALVAFAREHAGFDAIAAAVDAPNTASIRVLEKSGFERSGEAPGAFGRTYLFRLDPPGG